LRHLPETVSLLKSRGHVNADFYPVWYVWSEAAVAKKLMDRELTRQTISRFVVAIAATPKQGKKAKSAAQKAGKMFSDFLKGLSDG
jgi:hypothetical protein